LKTEKEGGKETKELEKLTATELKNYLKDVKVCTYQGIEALSSSYSTFFYSLS